MALNTTTGIHMKRRWKQKDLRSLEKKRSKKKKASRKKLRITSDDSSTIMPNAKGIMCGYRQDIRDCKKKQSPKGLYLRSSWEANYARYLMFLMDKGNIQRWEYEPETFWFEGIKRGVTSYLPDFKIWETLEQDPYFVEVKGYMDSKSATKLKRMAKYYPAIRVDLIDKVKYNEIKNKLSSIIPNWEYPSV